MRYRRLAYVRGEVLREARQMDGGQVVVGCPVLGQSGDYGSSEAHVHQLAQKLPLPIPCDVLFHREEDGGNGQEVSCARLKNEEARQNHRGREYKRRFVDYPNAPETRSR